MKKKLPLTKRTRDLFVLVHEMEVDYPGQDRRPEGITSTLIDEGEPGGFTAMARTVGMPPAIAVKLLLTGELPLTGSFIPTHPSIYVPVLREMRKHSPLGDAYPMLRPVDRRQIVADRAREHGEPVGQELVEIEALA